jgi:hypothetical protein
LPLDRTWGLCASLVAAAGGLRSAAEHRLLGDLGEPAEAASLVTERSRAPARSDRKPYRSGRSG